MRAALGWQPARGGHMPHMSPGSWPAAAARSSEAQRNLQAVTPVQGMGGGAGGALTTLYIITARRSDRKEWT